MKKNVNVIQIKGIKGLLFAGFIVTCLTAGFAVFPGWVMMNLWNIAVNKFMLNVPAIGLFQGVLLWGIIVASYFVFKKDKLVVCFRTPKGLSEEELKEVFSDIKKQSEADPVLQAMLKAREAELKIKQQEETESKTSK